MKETLKNALRSFFGIKVRLWALLLACVLGLGAGWTISARRQEARFGGSDSYAAAQKYLEVQKILDDYYVGDTDNAAMGEAAYAAMVKSLGDQWSYYMTASDYEAYKLYSANQYQGVGITITAAADGGGYEITAVTAGSPAETAGIQAGEVLMAVDGQAVGTLSVSDVRTLIQSHLDESVTLTIKGEKGTRDVDVDCTVIYTDPVSYKMLASSVGYVKIVNFESGAGDKAIAAVDDLLAQGATSLVFDVRENSASSSQYSSG